MGVVMAAVMVVMGVVMATIDGCHGSYGWVSWVWP